MRLVAVFLLLLSGAAAAQTARQPSPAFPFPPGATPYTPGAAPPAPPPPSAPAPAPDASSAPGAQPGDAAQPPQLAPGAQLVAPPTAVPESWLPKGEVELAGLDKITARQTKFVVRMGETASFGTLRITPKYCVVRGPDQPADQAVYLDIADTRRPEFAFHSWMLLSDPAVAVVEHPVYDVRLVGCR
jgi:hypothetical protein